MPRKKKEKLVHFDIDSLSKHAPSKKAPVQPATLGQMLQFKREKKRLSLQDISQKLCIKEVYLRALEEGHYYAFPSRVYGVGFLRSYAKYLGLDADTLVAQFYQETADIKEEPMDMLVIEKHWQLPSRKTLWIVFSLICTLVFAWILFSEILTPDSFSKISLPEWAAIKDDTPVDTTIEVPVTADEIKSDSETLEETKTETPQVTTTEEIKEVDPAAFQAKVAFIATHNIWVEITNKETGKKLISKSLAKNDYFAPTADLSVLTLSTGRSGLVLYKNGKKIKTFGAEKNLSLDDLAGQD